MDLERGVVNVTQALRVTGGFDQPWVSAHTGSLAQRVCAYLTISSRTCGQGSAVGQAQGLQQRCTL